MDMLLAFCRGPATNTDLIPKEYSWEELAQRMAKPSVGPKNGSYMLRGGMLKEYTRENDNLLEAELLIIDGDSSFDPQTGEVFMAVDPDDGKTKGNSTPIEVARDALDRLGYKYVIHTTHTNTPGILNKWRAFLPARMKSPAELEAAVDFVMAQMHAAGCYVESNKESKTWAQAWYLPRVKPQYVDSYKCFASLVGKEVDVQAAVGLAKRQKAAAEAAAQRQEAPKPKPAASGPSPIEQFNNAATMSTVKYMLEQAGYKFAYKRGDAMRFIAPASETGTPGVTVFKGTQRGDIVIYSHHGAHDPLSGRLNDAFGVLTRLRHGGNQESAMAEAKNVVGWKQKEDPLADFDTLEIDPEDFEKAPKPETVAKAVGPLFQRAKAFAAAWEPAEYLVDGIIQRGYCYSLTAPTGGGKTAVILNLTACIGSGRNFAGAETLAGKVGYFAAENPNDIQARWKGLEEVMNLDDPDVWFCPYTIDLKTSFDQIREEAEGQGGFDLIVVDTSQAFFNGEDENSNAQMVNHAKAMRRLTTLPGNPCVIILTHPIKNPSKDNLLPRGGGGFLAEVDGNLTIWNDQDNITFHHQGKFRGAGFAPINFVLKGVNPVALKDRKGRQIPTVVAEHVTEDAFRKRLADNATDEDKVMIILLSRRGDVSFADIAQLIGWVSPMGVPQKSKVARLVDALKRQKLITQKRNGKLALTTAGKAEIKQKAKALGIDGAGDDEGSATADNDEFPA